VRAFVRVVAALILVASALADLPGNAPLAAANGCWRRVPMPDVDGFIAGAHVRSSSSGWAVGYRLTPDSDIRAFSLRWDGWSWSTVSVPRTSGSEYLNGVLEEPGGTAWAVGETAGTTLVLRWNGSSWGRVPSPHPGTMSSLASIARDPVGGSILAVGWWVDQGREFHPLILRWTGTGWTTQLRRVGLFAARLIDITSTRGATWAIGDFGGHRHRTPLILRRTSRGWIRTPVPDAPGSRWMSAIAAAGSDDALAVGQRWGHAIVLHWNGRRWRPVPATRVPGLVRSEGLHDVAMLPSGEAWIVGSRSRATGSSDPDYAYHPQVILHRHGGTWAWERPPDVPYTLLSQVSVVSSSDIWTLGGAALEDGGWPLAFRC
jgi:hypothetical protein